ncbi:hypothetical protein C6P64_17375, partial [Malikia granosa]
MTHQCAHFLYSELGIQGIRSADCKLQYLTLYLFPRLATHVDFEFAGEQVKILGVFGGSDFKVP